VNNCAPTGSTCSNLGPGTYSCACNSGYNGTGTACTAINYCTFGNNTCAAVGSTCNYTGPGTFTCTCDRGYSGTGVSCTAINYCLGGNNCSSNAACNYTGLEPSLAHVTLDIRGMDTAVRLLTTVHKHHHPVRQRARRVPTLALEHFRVLASLGMVAMDSVAPRSTTALLGAVTAPLGIHLRAITLDQERTRAPAMPAIQGMGKLARVRPPSSSSFSSTFFFLRSTGIQFLSSDQLLLPWHRELLCHWVYLHIPWSWTVYMRVRFRIFGKRDNLHR